MTKITSEDPFAHVDDHAPVDAIGLRKLLLDSAKRGFAPIRKTFVQKPKSEANRASVLADMVRQRQGRALDALLLLHALEPVLRGSPLALKSWANMLGTEREPCTSASASKAFDGLSSLNLVERASSGRTPTFTLVLEDGSGHPWVRPGQDKATLGPGYFTIPYEYWTSGLVDRLRLPGKAMLLIMLAETTKNPSFAMAVERAQDWYGISERTAERGYRELREQGVLLEHPQSVADPRHPLGKRTVWHRALADPYSMFARANLQRSTQRAVRKRAQKEATPKAAAKKTTAKASRKRESRAAGSASSD